MWYNFKCRKCGKIISVDHNKCRREYLLGLTFTSNNHQCSFHNGLEDGERAYCDLISNSDHPLSYADEIIK